MIAGKFCAAILRVKASKNKHNALNRRVADTLKFILIDLILKLEEFGESGLFKCNLNTIHKNKSIKIVALNFVK